ncbi:MAG: amidohydrolase family protein [Caldilineaceae bacterium]
MNPNDQSWTGSLTDAYAHIGLPKYGSLQDVGRFFARLRIQQGVLVLGPGIPDLYSLMLAHQYFGENVRSMGIPFGVTKTQRLELGELQMQLGVSGLRIMPAELAENPVLLERLGQAGLWLFAINPFDSAQTVRLLLDWLERHPSGKVASPHFLRPRPLAQMLAERNIEQTLGYALLQHPRYHAIFSRQGGVGSGEVYPHPNLRPWVEQIAEQTTWQRILWGSEFPIIYQRNEQPEAARDWLLKLGVPISAQDAADFYTNNAQRLFFADPPPQPEIAWHEISMPAWVQPQIDQQATVYLFPTNQIFIPMQDHATLLSRYLELTQAEPTLGYAEFIARELSMRAEQIRGG